MHKFFADFLIYGGFRQNCQVGRSRVDRASSSDARGPGFEPRPLHFKKYHFFTLKPKGSPRSRARLPISELSVRVRGQAEKKWGKIGRNLHEEHNF